MKNISCTVSGWIISWCILSKPEFLHISTALNSFSIDFSVVRRSEISGFYRFLSVLRLTWVPSGEWRISWRFILRLCFLNLVRVKFLPWRFGAATQSAFPFIVHRRSTLWWLSRCLLLGYAQTNAQAPYCGLVRSLCICDGHIILHLLTVFMHPYSSFYFWSSLLWLTLWIEPAPTQFLFTSRLLFLGNRDTDADALLKSSIYSLPWCNMGLPSGGSPCVKIIRLTVTWSPLFGGSSSVSCRILLWYLRVTRSNSEEHYPTVPSISSHKLIKVI